MLLVTTRVSSSPVVTVPPKSAVAAASPRGFDTKYDAGLTWSTVPFALATERSKFGTRVGLRGSKMPGVPCGGRLGPVRTVMLSPSDATGARRGSHYTPELRGELISHLDARLHVIGGLAHRRAAIPIGHEAVLEVAVLDRNRLDARADQLCATARHAGLPTAEAAHRAGIDRGRTRVLHGVDLLFDTAVAGHDHRRLRHDLRRDFGHFRLAPVADGPRLIAQRLRPIPADTLHARLLSPLAGRALLCSRRLRRASRP